MNKHNHGNLPYSVTNNNIGAMLGNSYYFVSEMVWNTTCTLGIYA